jgi:heme oxygenase
VTRAGYALYLRNLLPAYTALEDGLRRHRATPGIEPFVRQELDREAAIIGDLAAIGGPGWASTLPVLPAARRYADAVTQAAAAGYGLIGHAYARYLGDLSGAQFMRRALVRTLPLGAEEQRFFDFPQIADADAFKRDYRAALDAAAGEVPDREVIVAAACTAFACNIEVSEAVLEATREPVA